MYGLSSTVHSVVALHIKLHTSTQCQSVSIWHTCR